MVAKPPLKPSADDQRRLMAGISIEVGATNPFFGEGTSHQSLEFAEGQREMLPAPGAPMPARLSLRQIGEYQDIVAATLPRYYSVLFRGERLPYLHYDRQRFPADVIPEFGPVRLHTPYAAM